MKKIFTFGVASLAIAGLVGIGTMNASALGNLGSQSGTRQHSENGAGNGYQDSLESRAKVLGMTADQLKTSLETKTLSQVAVERGISETDFQAKMQAAAKARWEARGLSASEIATRVAEQQKRHETNSADHVFGSGDGDHEGGYGRNR